MVSLVMRYQKPFIYFSYLCIYYS